MDLSTRVGLLDGYIASRKLNSRSLATVYLAKKRDSGEDVAVKVVDLLHPQ